MHLLCALCIGNLYTYEHRAVGRWPVIGPVKRVNRFCREKACGPKTYLVPRREEERDSQYAAMTQPASLYSFSIVSIPLNSIIVHRAQLTRSLYFRLKCPHVCCKRKRDASNRQCKYDIFHTVTYQAITIYY